MVTAHENDLRRRRGLAKLHDMASIAALDQFRATLTDIAPDLADYIVDFVYGDVFSRPGLSSRDQEIVTLGVLASVGGCEAQLALHVQLALNVGMDPAEIVDVLIHVAPYAGFPRALNAVEVARRVFVANGLIHPRPQDAAAARP